MENAPSGFEKKCSWRLVLISPTLATDENGAKNCCSQLGQSEGRGLFKGGACSEALRVSYGGGVSAVRIICCAPLLVVP